MSEIKPLTEDEFYDIETALRDTGREIPVSDARMRATIRAAWAERDRLGEIVARCEALREKWTAEQRRMAGVRLSHGDGADELEAALREKP